MKKYIISIILIVAFFILGVEIGKSKSKTELVYYRNVQDMVQDTIKVDTIKNVKERNFTYSVVSPNEILNSRMGINSKVGFIPNERVAIKVAMDILAEIYGKEVYEEIPVKISLYKNSTWLIEGSLKPGLFGGTFYIEIDKKSGEVKKIYHGK